MRECLVGNSDIGSVSKNMGVTRRSRDNRFGPILLVLCLLFAYGYNRVHHTGIRAEGINPALSLLRDYTLVPLENVSLKAGSLWKNSVAATFRGSRLAHENETLKSQVDDLQAQNRELLAEHDENTVLRQMIGFSQKSASPMLAAEVLSLKPSSLQDTLTLNRGLKSNVTVHSVVVDASGALVGQVLDATNSSSDVILISDQQSSVGAQVKARDGKTWVGICHGLHSDFIELTYLPVDAGVQPGDTVTTSGLGGVFPKNIPIGTIVSVHTDQNRSMKSADVQLDANLNQLDDAFVLQ